MTLRMGGAGNWILLGIVGVIPAVGFVAMVITLVGLFGFLDEPAASYVPRVAGSVALVLPFVWLARATLKRQTLIWGSEVWKQRSWCRVRRKFLVDVSEVSSVVAYITGSTARVQWVEFVRSDADGAPAARLLVSDHNWRDQRAFAEFLRRHQIAVWGTWQLGLDQNIPTDGPAPGR